LSFDRSRHIDDRHGPSCQTSIQSSRLV
jgi:hypothetical protein